MTAASATAVRPTSKPAFATHEQLMQLAQIRANAKGLPWDGRSQRVANSLTHFYDALVRCAMAVGGKPRIETTAFALCKAVYGADVVQTEADVKRKRTSLIRALKMLQVMEILDYRPATVGTGKSVGLSIELKAVPSAIDPGWVAQLVRAHDS